VPSNLYKNLLDKLIHYQGHSPTKTGSSINENNNKTTKRKEKEFVCKRKDILCKVLLLLETHALGMFTAISVLDYLF